MVSQDRPKATLRPPDHIARPVDEKNFRQSWMREQREAAMAAAKTNQGQEQQQEPEHTRSGPQLER